MEHKRLTSILTKDQKGEIMVSSAWRPDIRCSTKCMTYEETIVKQELIKIKKWCSVKDAVKSMKKKKKHSVGENIPPKDLIFKMHSIFLNQW